MGCICPGGRNIEGGYCTSVVVNRFRIALNSDDYGVVTKGLLDFTNLILQENDCVLSFGYKGRRYIDKMTGEGWEGAGGSEVAVVGVISDECIQGMLSSGDHIEAVGELSLLINSSPQLEELCQLWDIPGRNDDKALCAEHMTCIAAILHCSSYHIGFCTTVVNRILHAYTRSIHTQLSSNNTPLIHSTLGLLLVISRISPQLAIDLYKKIQLKESFFTYNSDTMLFLTICIEKNSQVSEKVVLPRS